MGTFKASVNTVCDYVLSQDHERKNFIEYLTERAKESTRTELRVIAENHVWYHAYKLTHGRQELRKELTEILNDIDCKSY